MTTQPLSDSVFMQFCNGCHSPTYNVLDFFPDNCEIPQTFFSKPSNSDPSFSLPFLNFWFSFLSHFALPIFDVSNILTLQCVFPLLRWIVNPSRADIFWSILPSSILKHNYRDSFSVFLPFYAMVCSGIFNLGWHLEGRKESKLHPITQQYLGNSHDYRITVTYVGYKKALLLHHWLGPLLLVLLLARNSLLTGS